MKLETQEKIRLATLLLAVGTNVGIQYAGENSFFADPERIRLLLDVTTLPYLLEVYTSLRQEVYTEEYKEIKSLYDTVIQNTTALMHEVEIEDPVQIFATYMYMYRHGYLSLNQEYAYKNDMKDFAQLGGVDVIRGKGVCRSVASNFTDVCNHMELKATNLIVKANNAIGKIEKLCDKDKPEIDKKTKLFVKWVVATTAFLPIANHQISMVEGKNKNYIFDPMNDGFLHKGKGNKLLIANDPSVHMTLFRGQYLVSRLMGNIKTTDLFSLQKQLALPTIDYEEYKQIYLETLHFCQNNIELFEDFYQTNSEIYEEIDNASNKQSNTIRRMLGLGPIERTIKGIKQKIK